MHNDGRDYLLVDSDCNRGSLAENLGSLGYAYDIGRKRILVVDDLSMLD